MNSTLRLVACVALLGIDLLLPLRSYGNVPVTPEDPAQDGGKDRKPTKEEVGGLSLKTTRKVEYSTSEGTWVSLDVSPDGKAIVFDLIGHLYVMSIDGGNATAITSGLPFDSQPRFSPDGKRIVFVSDRSGSTNVWIS